MIHFGKGVYEENAFLFLSFVSLILNANIINLRYYKFVIQIADNVSFKNIH